MIELFAYLAKKKKKKVELLRKTFFRKNGWRMRIKMSSRLNRVPMGGVENGRAISANEARRTDRQSATAGSSAESVCVCVSCRLLHQFDLINVAHSTFRLADVYAFSMHEFGLVVVEELCAIWRISGLFFRQSRPDKEKKCNESRKESSNWMAAWSLCIHRKRDGTPTRNQHKWYLLSFFFWFFKEKFIVRGNDLAPIFLPLSSGCHSTRNFRHLPLTRPILSGTVNRSNSHSTTHSIIHEESMCVRVCVRVCPTEGTATTIYVILLHGKIHVCMHMYGRIERQL